MSYRCLKQGIFRDLDSWIRRQLKHWKNESTVYRELRARGTFELFDLEDGGSSEVKAGSKYIATVGVVLTQRM